MAEPPSLRLWVTRTAPLADETAARLRALGHQPVTAPVLDWRIIEDAALDLGSTDALAFTSQNAVAAFARLSPRRDLPVFAIGDATAQASRSQGFADVRSAGGDVADLAALIAEARPGRVLHPGPRQAAGELPGVRAVIVYETVDSARAAPQAIDGVVVHSPRAARAVARALAGGKADGLLAYAISEAAASPLRALNFRHVAVAPYPNEAALLKLIGDTRDEGAQTQT